MDIEKKERNFYEEEAAYENAIYETKELVKNVVFLDVDKFMQKIKSIDNENKYGDFEDLFIAATGRKTNKYYYCKNDEDLKYHNLKQGHVYEMAKISVELQTKYSEEKILDLEARSTIAKLLFIKTSNLRQLFAQNVKSGVSLAETAILENDVEYLDNLLKYLMLLADKADRLKILVAERDIYAMKKAQEQYEKKLGVEKLFHKLMGTKKSVIEGLADQNKYRK